MPKFTYAVSQAGLEVPVLVGLDGQHTSDLVAAGKPVPAPVLVRGLLDSGSNMTAMAPWVAQKLRLASMASASTYTAGGPAAVQLFHVSITILPPSQQSGLITLPSVWVSELPVALPDADVLVGLNVLLQAKLWLDGPARSFSLDL
jgi:hypothetical protein